MSEPFALYDCSLTRQATGIICLNLRELQHAVRSVPAGVLEHHMMRCALDDPFELYEFPNDLARWCWRALGDQPLGERLGLVDPYRLPSIEAVRAELIEIIEERLWTLDHIPWSRPGLELPLQESRLIAYDTGERFETPVALAEAIGGIPLRSLFFHVHEARRRTGGESDDFSLWLESHGVSKGFIDRLRTIDFYFLNLRELRKEMSDLFHQHVLAGSVSERGAA